MFITSKRTNGVYSSIMPRKQNILPRPCPICNQVNGTIVIVDSHKGLNIRIGHYDKNKRKKAIDEGLTPSEKNIDKKIETKIKTKSRRWCTFTSYSRAIDKIDNELSDLLLKGKYFGPSKQNPPRTINLTKEGKNNFVNHIKKNGWEKR
jgi:hypothetical protein